MECCDCAGDVIVPLHWAPHCRHKSGLESVRSIIVDAMLPPMLHNARCHSAAAWEGGSGRKCQRSNLTHFFLLHSSSGVVEQIFKVPTQGRVRQRVVEQNIMINKALSLHKVQRRCVELWVQQLVVDLIFKALSQDRVQQLVVDLIFMVQSSSFRSGARVCGLLEQAVAEE